MALPLEKKQKIVELAEAQPRPTNKEIASMVGCHVNTVARILENCGVVRK